MDDRLAGIEVFVASAESPSFAQAATRLHLTRSAVAKSVARLEARLGVRLFHRTTRRQSLTEEGTVFYEYCLRALGELKAAEDLLEGGKGMVSGRLKVSMPVLFGHLCIAPLLSRFARKHSGLGLEMSFNDRVVDLVEEGFDLAIRIGTLPPSTNLVARRLGEHKMAFCAAPDYLQRRGMPKTLEDLRQHDAVAYTRLGRVLSWQVLRDGRSEEFKPAARILADDMQAVAASAVAGLGIAWLPYWLVHRFLQTGELTELFVDHASVSFTVNAVWPYMPRLPPKVRLAVDLLVEELPPLLSAIEAASLGAPDRSDLSSGSATYNGRP